MEETIGTDPSGGVSAAENPEPATVETAQEAPVGEFADLEAQLSGKPEAGVIERLKEIAQKRDEYKTQAEAAAQYEPWAPVLEAFQTNLGLNPEQVLEYLQKQPTTTPQVTDPAQAAQDRQAQFTEFLKAKAPAVLEGWEYLEEYQKDDWAYRFEQYEERQQELKSRAEEQAKRTQAEQDLEFKTIQADERFKGWVQDPVLADLIRLGQSYGFPGTQIAEKLHGSLEGIVQARLAAYTTGKAQDAQIPVVSGGSSPTPAPRLDLQDRNSRLDALDRLANQAPV